MQRLATLIPATIDVVAIGNDPPTPSGDNQPSKKTKLDNSESATVSHLGSTAFHAQGQGESLEMNSGDLERSGNKVDPKGRWGSPNGGGVVDEERRFCERVLAEGREGSDGTRDRTLVQRHLAWVEKTLRVKQDNK